MEDVVVDVKKREFVQITVLARKKDCENKVSGIISRVCLLVQYLHNFRSLETCTHTEVTEYFYCFIFIINLSNSL